MRKPMFCALVYYILNSGITPQIFIDGKSFSIPENFTSYSKELITSCMNKNPSERPSFEAIVTQIYQNMHNLLEISANEKQEIQRRMMKIKEKSL